MKKLMLVALLLLVTWTLASCSWRAGGGGDLFHQFHYREGFGETEYWVEVGEQPVRFGGVAHCVDNGSYVTFTGEFQLNVPEQAFRAHAVMDYPSWDYSNCDEVGPLGVTEGKFYGRFRQQPEGIQGTADVNFYREQEDDRYYISVVLYVDTEYWWPAGVDTLQWYGPIEIGRFKSIPSRRS